VNGVISAGFEAMKMAVHGVVVKDKSEKGYSKDWSKEDKEKFEQKAKDLAKEIADEAKNSKDPTKAYKNLWVDKDTGEIFIVDENGKTILQKITYDDGVFKTIDFENMQNAISDIISGVILPSFKYACGTTGAKNIVLPNNLDV
jgi:hypothetical protein